ncbi:hypothetical protein H310_11799 [Aphanomyces invadans]|uniref:Uncharacterized protein n=1 Tax=Aphanomyces invadans TaxID=157072 RepID=A0A024TKC1_9STRA|nr:hypothetical protein H310_11799 [Aphanomyces invadans]ETV94478.1 hypothetical protein H310_11799 [Aphanomyces invadans]RHY32993.1 hypothetical protein DYB32_002006 [Aphanomyces invadans]|eukprot:XP_008876793.1 hypothetical protein H310_11799 [Aphanomyces invadans]
MTSSSSSLLQYSHVILTCGDTDMPSITSLAPMTQQLLAQEIFQYDFSKERAVIESSNSHWMSQDAATNDEELVKTGMAILNMVDHHGTTPPSPEKKSRAGLDRRNSAEEAAIAMALAVSLEEY